MSAFLFLTGMFIGGLLAWDSASRKRLRSHRIAYRAGARHVLSEWKISEQKTNLPKSTPSSP